MYPSIFLGKYDILEHTAHMAMERQSELCHRSGLRSFCGRFDTEINAGVLHFGPIF